jgi:hypothetical protein
LRFTPSASTWKAHDYASELIARNADRAREVGRLSSARRRRVHARAYAPLLPGLNWLTASGLRTSVFRHSPPWRAVVEVGLRPGAHDVGLFYLFAGGCARRNPARAGPRNRSPTVLVPLPGQEGFAVLCFR